MGLLKLPFQIQSRNYGTALAALHERLSKELDEYKEAGSWLPERVITTKQDVKIQVSGSSKKILNFCSNNYLGLSSHPDVVKAGIKALKDYGAGLSSVRLVCGTLDIHKELENKISEFHQRDDTMLYASCFAANIGLFGQLLGPEDAVLSDALNHASIIDGIRLCKAKKMRYNHKDMADLEAKLQETQDCRTRLIATDGVFSMDGNIAPLGKICDLADKYNALVFIDECHATGFFGKTGRGTEEFLGLPPGRVDIISSTLGKALGGAAGGYTSGSKHLINLLRQKARPYVFSNSIPPPVVACANQAFTMILKDSSLVEKITSNSMRFRSHMKAAGFTIAGEDHPISPVMLGDAKLASDFTDDMFARGIYVVGISYPIVPKGKARIRVVLSAAHTTEDIDRTVEAFIEVGKARGVIN